MICDFQKALDKVPCVKLLQKFKTCSLTGKILYRFYNWLYGRQKCVVLNGTVPGQLFVLSSVPQDSNFRPLLFFIFSKMMACQEAVKKGKGTVSRL